LFLVAPTWLGKICALKGLFRGWSLYIWSFYILATFYLAN
jgi:hypothetical protein